MKKHFIVIGLGRFGKSVAETLEDMGEEILAVDNKPDAVAEVSKNVSNCVIADATKLDVLEDIGVEAYDHAVVAIGNNLEASILTVTNLKRLGVRKITVRVDTEEHKEIFRLLGANEIVVPEEAAGIDLANQIYSDAIIEYHIIAGDYVMAKIQNDYAFTKTLIQLDLRNKFGINIVGIVRNKQFFIPRGTDFFMKEDVIVVAGKKNKIKKFAKYISKRV